MNERTRAWLPYLAVAALCGASGAYLALNRANESKLERASADIRAGHRQQALADLDGASGQASRRAAALRGYAYLGRGQFEPAAAQFARATRQAPNDWELQRDYAIVLRRLGRRVQARARMQRALALNPRIQLPRGFQPKKQKSPARRGR